jgi:hypothetical protein
MNMNILLVLLFCNAYVALNYFVLMIFSLLFIMFLQILCNFVTYYSDLIAYSIAISCFHERITHSIRLVRMMDPCMYVCVCMYKAKSTAIPLLSLWTFHALF